MNDYEDIQSKAVSLIGAITYLDSVTVHTDDGYKNSAIEKDRRESGCTIVVRKPEGFQAESHASGLCLGTTTITVTVTANQGINLYNSSGLSIDLERAEREIRTALCAYDTDNSCAFFFFDGSDLGSKEGLYERNITFTAPTTA